MEKKVDTSNTEAMEAELRRVEVWKGWRQKDGVFAYFEDIDRVNVSLKDAGDEFGDLKKNHVKTNQTDIRPAVAGGRALLEVEVIGKL
ncbi:unnamed protein product [Eruca vesicaria subsp. sativa]|uniref:Uncharacterized protein n=1 Tax=Eruca vesicaria subsp. sativa TaxID=29727 RepID=A0ABC8L3Y0_ERUVS|nr:unnamed protein product [Eruca vesicaria subsp. sativa]